MAIRLEWDTPEEHFLFRRAGFSNEGMTRANDVPPYIVFMNLNNFKAHYDAFTWGDRTMRTAHAYIIAKWDELKSGDVVDVEFILNEVTEPAVSERLGGGI